MTLFVFYINILLLNIVFANLERIKYLRKLYNNINEIHLVIKGDGNQNLLNSQFHYTPSVVLVNGFHNVSCRKSCYLTEDDNNITLQFSEQITTCKKMFLNLNNIIEIDLSNFDFSQVTNMAMMLKGCTNLETIIFGNINIEVFLLKKHFNFDEGILLRLKIWASYLYYVLV